MKQSRLTPSVLFLVTLVIGVFFSWLAPFKISVYLDAEIVRRIGISILLTSLLVNILAYRVFKRCFTPYAPFSNPKVLIQKGIFTLSRNPVYVALVLSQLGLGFVIDSVWILLTSIILLGLLHFMIVLDEEKVLENNFKDEYIHYKEQTRRWI